MCGGLRPLQSNQRGKRIGHGLFGLRCALGEALSQHIWRNPEHTQRAQRVRDVCRNTIVSPGMSAGSVCVEVLLPLGSAGGGALSAAPAVASLAAPDGSVVSEAGVMGSFLWPTAR